MFISDEEIAFQQHGFIKKKLFKFAILLLIIASLNYGLFIFAKTDVIGKVLGSYQKCFYLLAFISAIKSLSVGAFQPDVLLPFNPRVFPNFSPNTCIISSCLNIHPFMLNSSPGYK